MRDKYGNDAETIINNPSDIPKGIVEKRKAELLLAKLNESENNRETQEIKLETTHSALTHPTLDRPKINHRLPSFFNYRIPVDILVSLSKDENKAEDNPDQQSPRDGSCGQVAGC
ncbi:hypothetical protein EP47_06210 [Legionella norrlandica]|uniref:Uncharacterized protein n=1 Tax=Legionella norrlandica TaxID=1498499 RepID=A0A0A2SRZ2_9GAMM|nr:hypothetical protein [Legionella norrlandica]KGP62496.1 hypothetical protein EP47_06210 [Legionella norrlandica]